jgi:hypothetical protein
VCVRSGRLLKRCATYRVLSLPVQGSVRRHYLLPVGDGDTEVVTASVAAVTDVDRPQLGATACGNSASSQPTSLENRKDIRPGMRQNPWPKILAPLRQ